MSNKKVLNRKFELTLVYENPHSSFPKTAVCYIGKTRFKRVKVVKIKECFFKRTNTSKNISPRSVIEVYLNNWNHIQKIAPSQPYVAKIIDANTENNLVVFDFFKSTLDEFKVEEVFVEDSTNHSHFTPKMQSIVRILVEAFVWLRTHGLSLSVNFSAESIIFQDDNTREPKLIDIWHTNNEEKPEHNLQRLAKILMAIATKFDRRLSTHVKWFLETLMTTDFDANSLKIFPCLWPKGYSRKFVIEASLVCKNKEIEDEAAHAMNFAPFIHNSPDWKSLLVSDNILNAFFNDKKSIYYDGKGNKHSIYRDDFYGLFWFTRCLYEHYNEWAIRNNVRLMVDREIEEKVEKLSNCFLTRAVVGLVFKNKIFEIPKRDIQ